MNLRVFGGGVHVYDLIPLTKILEELVIGLRTIIKGDGLGAPKAVNYVSSHQ